MTPKERAAMQQALEALEAVSTAKERGFGIEYAKGYVDPVIIALREALDHSGEANEMVIGWDRVKPEAIGSDPLYQQGFVDGVEEGRNQVAEQAEQEPVGVVTKEALDGVVKWKGWVPREGTKLYAATVRTKDLTVDDLRVCFKTTNTSEPLAEGWPGLERFARAVIAADREKNK